MSILEDVAKLYIELINTSRLKFNLKTASIDYEINEKTGEVKILFPEYYYIIEKGQKPLEKVPIENLLKWMKNVGINPTNKIAYAIQSKIYLAGISPKKGFISQPLAEGGEGSKEIIAINFSSILDKKIKKII